MAATMSDENGMRSHTFFTAEPLTRPANGEVLRTPVLIVGGSTAAYAAALALGQVGQAAIWVSPTAMVGGQYTAQVVAAVADRLPESWESVAISRSQRAIRQQRRSHQPVAGRIVANPGGAWGGHLATTPIVTTEVLATAIAPYLQAKPLQLIVDADPVAVITTALPGQRRRVTGVQFCDRAAGARFTVMAAVVIEATDLGDVLALGAIESRIGQESAAETGEAVLPATAYPDCQQPFTWAAVVERTAPGAGQPISPPTHQASAWLDAAEFTATVWTRDPHQRWQAWNFLSPLGLFRYGRLARSQPQVRQVSPGDVAVIAWGITYAPDGTPTYGNDYRFGNLVGVSAEERAQQLQRARDRTLAYLHFLQTHATPDLKLRADAAGSQEGLAIAPYIREARRGIALKTIRHEELAVSHCPSPRATCYPDSVGIGRAGYIDLRRNTASGHVHLKGDAAQARPLMLPARALIPVATDGLILSSKSIGTTHITNGVYHLPTVEWAIGEASGLLAAAAISGGRTPREVVTHEVALRSLQQAMLRQGIPLYWFDDIAHDDPDFEAIHMMAIAGQVGSVPADTLHFSPQQPVPRGSAAATLVNVLKLTITTPPLPTFQDVIPGQQDAYTAIETLYLSGIADGVSRDRFAPHKPLLRSTLAKWIRKAAPIGFSAVFGNLPVEHTPLLRREWARVLYALASHLEQQ